MQEVTDIATVVSGLVREQKLMRENIDRLTSENHVKQRHIECLERDMRNLRKENAELRDRLSHYEKPDKDSSNSGVPPSKEPMRSEITRRTSTLRKPSDRKPGGQQGHKGATLTSLNSPDGSASDITARCPECGTDCGDAERVLDYTSQVVSLPELRPVVKEIRHYSWKCPKCGTVVRPSSPRRRGHGQGSVVYDGTVKAIAVYMSAVQFLPYARIEAFFREVLGLGVSQGTLVNWVMEARRKDAPAIDEIKRRIMGSDIVGFDESGLFCEKRLNWAWIAQTVYYTLVFRASGRGSKELTSRFGDSLGRMTAVTDRHSAYFVVNFLNHQVCLAHLLRELQWLDETDKEQQWSPAVGRLLREAIHERNTSPGVVIDKKPWIERLDKLLNENLGTLRKEFERLRRGLEKCKDYIFNFLSNPAVPPDNNASERGIRSVKLKMNNSRTFRSGLGADAFLELHSIVETTRKHGQSPFNAIRALF